MFSVSDASASDAERQTLMLDDDLFVHSVWLSIDLDGLEGGISAPNVDARAQRPTLRDFSCGQDGAVVPDRVVTSCGGSESPRAGWLFVCKPPDAGVDATSPANASG
jgi:hypothetical protein